MTGPRRIAQAWTNLRPCESGKSTHKPRQISKAGNRHLRDAFYFLAMVASCRDPKLKAVYETLIERGKKPLQALVAVMRKLLLVI